MIPILYETTETDFTTNGLGRLANCLSCVVTEERNGIYECKFTYPITGAMYSKLQIGRTICVTHDDGHDVQPFDIYKRTAPLNGIVTFYAHHISYRLGGVIVKPFTASTCAEAIAGLKTNTYTTNPFTFWTDKSVVANWSNEVPAACKALLGGSTGSLLDVYGTGEYEFDKWTVRLYVNRGADNGVSIRYGVNLIDAVQDLDESGSYTAVAPFWKSTEAGDVVTLPEGYIMRGNMPMGLFPWQTNTKAQMQDNNGVDFEFKPGRVIVTPLDLSSAFSEKPTVAQLRQKAQAQLNSSRAWLPDENITVNFIDLSQTEEYKNVAALQSVKLCDRVNVYCGPIGVNAVSMQVIKTEYNVLLERYDKIELGSARTTLADSVSKRVQSALYNVFATKNLVSSTVGSAIDNATKQITGAKNSHVRFIYDANGGMQEIVVMDTADIATAKNVWRWNRGGLGFSSNGYDGPYSAAITQDGAIVADFITTGQLLANLITAGTMLADRIKGGTLTLGGSGNGNGVLEIRDANERVVGTWDNEGIKIKLGEIVADVIRGGTLNLGGANNKYGVLKILDNNENEIGGWGRNGIEVLGGSIRFPFESNRGNGVLHLSGDSFHPFAYSRTYNGQSQTIYIGDSLDIYDQRYGQSQINSCYARFTRFAGGSIANGVFVNDDTINFKASYTAEGVDLLDYPNGKRTRYEYDRANVQGNIHAVGNITCEGTKSRSVKTDQYSDRLLYCYETPSPLFGDVGEGVISDDGKCYVWLDPVFAQTISTNQYQVFLQSYGNGGCWVAERHPGYFVVEGTPGMAFGWEIKAKQKDFDQRRLDVVQEPAETTNKINYGVEAMNYLTELRGERVS